MIFIFKKSENYFFIGELTFILFFSTEIEIQSPETGERKSTVSFKHGGIEDDPEAQGIVLRRK